MATRLYKLDYINEQFISTLMGEYPTLKESQAAQNEFRKHHKASWMISSGEVDVRKDESAVKIAAL